MPIKVIQYTELPEDLENLLEEHCQVTRFDSLELSQGAPSIGVQDDIDYLR